jgi:uncharacterized protein YcbK (DUF882 family)
MKVRALAAKIALATLVVAAPAFAEPPKPAPKRTASVAPAAKRANAVPASRGWHTMKEGATAPVDDTGRAKLVLQGLNIPDHVELTAHGERGGFSAEDLDRAAHVMREPSSGNEHPIDPRLLDFIYRVATHFKSPEVRVLSGYRTPRGGKTSTSNHGRGRAMDCVFPGTSDEDVAKFAREQGFVGVGVYPVSGFVHLDIRERSFFWVDTSGPGKKSRLRGILGDLAAKSDAAALARGDKAVGPFVVGTDVDAVMGSQAVAASGSAPSEDDDTEESALP